MTGHAHHDDRRRVLLALALTGAFTVVEVVAGIVTGSLALLADAGHMLTDTLALGLAALAFRIGDLPADRRRSYGYQRFQILAAFANAVALILIVGWICVEAVLRFLTPTPIAAEGMLFVASAGLVVNIVCFAILHGGGHDNLNVQGAALHVLGDLLGSVAAIIAALVIIYTGWLPIDALLSVFVAMLVLRSAWILLKRSAHILLEGTPDRLDVDAMCAALREKIPAVASAHHVHVWGLTQENLMLTMHVVLADDCSDPGEVVRQVKALLTADFDIRHSTIEVEAGRCADHND
ncbi:MAG: cation diffusion facilitator family transporter [Woeseia sp.]